MIRRALLLLPLLLPAEALAQSPSETRLRLGATAQVLVAPDELAATLRIEQRGDDAASAQARVNARMDAALAAARNVAGVTPTTGHYGSYNDRQAGEVVAQQSLSLVATRGEAALALIGRLQAEGLLLSELRWRLSPAAAAAARDAALREALRELQERAAMIARELGMRVVALSQLSVDAGPEARPMAMAMAAAPRAAAAPQPVVTAEDIPVSFSLTGDLLLRR